MNSPSVDIKSYLVSSTVGITTPIQVGLESDGPDELITLFDTNGQNPESMYNYERPGLMVRVRGERKDYTGAYTLAAAIKTALHVEGETNGLRNQTIGGTRYIATWAEGDIHWIGYDEQDRPIFTVNFIVHRTA